MKTQEVKKIEKEIDRIKQALMEIGEMRPGSLTLQYKKPLEKKGGYWQISYTHKMKSRTEYVRSNMVRQTRRQIAVYKRFKRLIERWVELAIAHAQQKAKDYGKKEETGPGK